MTTSLLIIDIQNDYFPGGKNPLEGSPAAGQQARALLDYFRQAGLPVVHIQHLSTRPDASFFLPGTDGVEIHEDVRPLPGETIVQKHFPNSFRQTPLLERLHSLDVQRLVICGMMTHMCVDASVRAAVDLGLECLLAEDACATKPLIHAGEMVPARHVHLAILAALDKTYAKVAPAAELIAALTAA